MTATAAWPIQVAVATLLATIADKTIDGETHHLGGHQEGEVDRDDPLPYWVLGAATEPGDSRRYQSQSGLDQTLRINTWAATKLEALTWFAEVKAKLDGVQLVLTGYGKAVLCTLSLVTDFAEPDPEVTGHVVVAQLNTRTIEA